MLGSKIKLFHYNVIIVNHILFIILMPVLFKTSRYKKLRTHFGVFCNNFTNLPPGLTFVESCLFVGSKPYIICYKKGAKKSVFLHLFFIWIFY